MSNLSPLYSEQNAPAPLLPDGAPVTLTLRELRYAVPTKADRERAKEIQDQWDEIEAIGRGLEAPALRVKSAEKFLGKKVEFFSIEQQRAAVDGEPVALAAMQRSLKEEHNRLEASAVELLQTLNKLHAENVLAEIDRARDALAAFSDYHGRPDLVENNPAMRALQGELERRRAGGNIDFRGRSPRQAWEDFALLPTG